MLAVSGRLKTLRIITRDHLVDIIGVLWYSNVVLVIYMKLKLIDAELRYSENGAELKRGTIILPKKEKTGLISVHISKLNGDFFLENASVVFDDNGLFIEDAILYAENLGSDERYIVNQSYLSEAVNTILQGKGLKESKLQEQVEKANP